MLIFPIINRKRVMNVELSIKDASKIKELVNYEDVNPSDIVVNGEKFSASSFKKLKKPNVQVDFIRSKSILYPRNFIVSTKNASNSTKYDIYELPQPPKKVNDNLDILYSKSILDLQEEIPNKPNRGRYISFEDLGLSNDLDDEKISRLQEIIKSSSNDKFGDKLKEAGMESIIDSINFFNAFECTVLSDTIIPEESLLDTLKALSNIHTRDYKNLKKFYNMAKSNTEIFTKMSYISKIVYDKPLILSQTKKSNSKKLVKKKEEGEYRNAA